MPLRVLILLLNCCPLWKFVLVLKPSGTHRWRINSKFKDSPNISLKHPCDARLKTDLGVYDFSSVNN